MLVGRRECWCRRGVVQIGLALGLLTGGLGATLDALPAAAAAPDGSGTMTVSPATVPTSSIDNTLTFTYTAASGGLSSGVIDVFVPSSWSPPSVTGSDPGYTISTCGTVAASLSLVGTVIEVAGITLAAGSNCTITYGSTASGGPGAMAPSSPETDTFFAYEKSTIGGTVSTLASSPQVTVEVNPVARLFGSDAIGTSITVSQALFQLPGSAAAVVLARSDAFPDALAGGPLAANVGGPLLITPGTPLSNTIDARVLAEIQRVLPVGGTVYILGGVLALSPNIDTALQAAGYVVQRVAGPNEFATAVAIANQIGNPSPLFEVTGLNFPDALSAVPVASDLGGAILLTNGTTQAPETAAYLALHPGPARYVIGGPLAAYQDPAAVTSVYGQDEFGTSAAVATYFFGFGLFGNRSTIYGIATGLNFPDALSGGAALGTIFRLGGIFGPMLLVNPSAPLPPTIAAYLRTLAAGTEGIIFGGPLAVAADIVPALQAAVG